MSDDPVRQSDIERLERGIEKLETRMWVSLGSGFSAIGILLVQTVTDVRPVEAITGAIHWIGG